MANVVKIKQSAVASKVPLTTDLEFGELAINTNDGKLFLKKNPTTPAIFELGSDKVASSRITISSSTPTGGVDGDLWFQYTP
jgi:hypothetical protein